MRVRHPPSRQGHWTAVALVVTAATVAGILMASHLRRPAETVLSPEADAYVSTAHPDTNYGTASSLRADAAPKIRSHLRFRLAGLPGRVVRAELRLWSATGDLAGYSVHPAIGKWIERDITSNSGPAAGTPVASSGPFAPGSWSRVDVTPLIENHRAVSLVVTTRSSQNITFDSREGSNKPRLVVETRPTPDSPPGSVPARLPGLSTSRV